MKFTYYGQSCFMLETAGKKVLFDPFISPNDLARNIDITQIHPDFILVSHGHFDHVNDLPAIALQSNALVISSEEIINWAEKQGITHTQRFNLGCIADFDFGRMRVVPAVHTSTLPDGNDGGPPTGLVIETEGKVVYFAGDTALNYEMKVLPLLYKKIDLALLPIGGYFTMDSKEAAIAAKEFLQCNEVIGMHFDTFPPITINKPEAKENFAKKGVNLHLIEIGESFNF